MNAIIDLRAKCPNKTVGRGGYKIEGLCNHITSGTKESALSWMMNPVSQVSCHYLVCRNGDIYQLVDDYNQSWCQGIVKKPTSKLYTEMKKVNPNRYLIGIEHEGTDGTLTPEQYQATLELHASLVMKYKIPLDGKHIIGHFELDSVFRANCPGPKFPWEDLLTDIGMNIFKENVLMKLYNRQKINSPNYWMTTCRLGEECKGQYVESLLLNMTGQDTLEHAVDFLTKLQIINTPDYWLQNARKDKTVKGLYMKALLEKMVKLL